MSLVFLINIFVPLIAGLIYLVLILELNRVSKIRKMMFGEIGYKKMIIAFFLLGIYLVTRPLQNILGASPLADDSQSYQADISYGGHRSLDTCRNIPLGPGREKFFEGRMYTPHT